MTPLRPTHDRGHAAARLAPPDPACLSPSHPTIRCTTANHPIKSSRGTAPVFPLSPHHKHVARSTATVPSARSSFSLNTPSASPGPRSTVRPRPTHTLPVVLSVDEVWRIWPVAAALLPRLLKSHLHLWLAAALKASALQVKQIDSARMQLHIQGGKGNKDRYVPLPPRTLTLLRTQWLTHRNPVWLFRPPRTLALTRTPPPSPE